MGSLFSKKSTPAPTPPTHAPDVNVGNGHSLSIDGKDQKHINKLTAGAGSTVTFGGLQNLNSMNLQNLREEPEMINLATLSPIEQKILMNLKAEREFNPEAYVNHLAQLL